MSFVNMALLGEVTSKVEAPAENLGYFFVRLELPKRGGQKEVQRWKIIVYHENLRKAQAQLVSGRWVHATGRPGVNVYQHAEKGTIVTLELRATTIEILDKPKGGDQNG